MKISEQVAQLEKEKEEALDVASELISILIVNAGRRSFTDCKTEAMVKFCKPYKARVASLRES